MASACLAMIAPPFFPSPAAEQSQSQSQSQFQCPSLSSLPKLQELKGLLPLHLHAQATKPNSGNFGGGGGDQSLRDPSYPALIDMQGSQDDPVLFSFRITEHSSVLSYLMPGSGSGSEAHFSQLCHLLAFQPCLPHVRNVQMLPINIDMLMQMPPEQAQLLAQFLARLSPASVLSVHPSGRILFTGTPSEMRDLLSILAEFNTPMLPQGHNHPSKVSLLVPYFDRTRGRAKVCGKVSVLNFPTETVVAPSKSNGANKTKSSQKKRQKNNTSYNRDIFQKNYFHVCESLLSLLLDKSSTGTGRGTGVAILSLKKLGPEIAHILTSFSIGIAGTGLAVLFSVACKMAGPGTRVPISASRVFNAGFGLGLFWLSWAVNGLRDTIVQVFKDSNKLKMKDEEMMALKVERSMRDVLFRAGALVALAALRFA